MPKQDDAPVVAPRNDPAALEPYSRSRALELAGRRPDMEYQWIRRDQVADYTRAREIGNQYTGYLMVDPWEVVDDKQGLSQGKARADAGKPVDTVMTNGELILVCTTKENHRKYAVIEEKMDGLIDKRLSKGERINLPGGSNFKTRTVGGRAGLDIDPNEALSGAGV